MNMAKRILLCCFGTLLFLLKEIRKTPRPSIILPFIGPVESNRIVLIQEPVKLLEDVAIQ